MTHLVNRHWYLLWNETGEEDSQEVPFRFPIPRGKGAPIITETKVSQEHIYRNASEMKVCKINMGK